MNKKKKSQFKDDKQQINKFSSFRAWEPEWALLGNRCIPEPKKGVCRVPARSLLGIAPQSEFSANTQS